MRLSADAVLLVIDAEWAIGRPRAQAAIVTLLEAWRGLGLPVLHARGEEGDEPPAALAASPGEARFTRATDSAFADGRLDAALSRLGVTMLVLCGGPTQGAIEASARSALDLGYRVFLSPHACVSAPLADLSGRAWTAEEAQALSFAALEQAGARIVSPQDCIEAARAAAGHRDRKRR